MSLSNVNIEEGVQEYAGDLNMTVGQAAAPVTDFFSNKELDIELGKKELKNKLKQQKGFVNKGLEVETNARLSQFSKEKIYPGQWTESTMNLLESWMSKSRKASALHGNAARGCRTKHRMLAIPTLIVGATASALAFFSAGDTCDPNDDGSNGLKYTTAILTSTLAVMGGIGALYSFAEKQSQNIVASGNFANLATRIEVQIYLPNELRANSEVVLTDFSAQYEHLVETSPLL